MNIIPRFHLFLSLLFTTAAYSQSITCTVIGDLPGRADEASGIDYYNGQNIFVHNDAGGNDHRIFGIDSTSHLIKTINIINACDSDWEDLTHDAAYNFLFIGDFGNNNYDRTDLRIWRVPYSTLLTDTVATADVINFSYPDQTEFPALWKNFDMETFFHHNGMLYLFSKNSGSAVGYTKLYSLPDTPGTYVATLIDSFYTSNRITSGDINAAGTAIAIMSNARVHIFQNWTGNNFFNGTHIQVDINGASTQKEGIAFVTDNLVYMVDEADTLGDNYLYSADLSQWIPFTTGVKLETRNWKLEISPFPNPCNEKINFRFAGSKKKFIIEIFNSFGEKISFDEKINESETSFSIETAKLPEGEYYLRISAEGNVVETKKIIVGH